MMQNLMQRCNSYSPRFMEQTHAIFTSQCLNDFPLLVQCAHRRGCDFIKVATIVEQIITSLDAEYKFFSAGVNLVCHIDQNKFYEHAAIHSAKSTSWHSFRDLFAVHTSDGRNAKPAASVISDMPQTHSIDLYKRRFVGRMLSCPNMRRDLKSHATWGSMPAEESKIVRYSIFVKCAMKVKKIMEHNATEKDDVVEHRFLKPYKEFNQAILQLVNCQQSDRSDLIVGEIDEIIGEMLTVAYDAEKLERQRVVERLREITCCFYKIIAWIVGDSPEKQAERLLRSYRAAFRESKKINCAH